MANDLDWLEVEIRQCHEASVAIHNEPSRERYSAWLGAIARIRLTLLAADVTKCVVPECENIGSYNIWLCSEHVHSSRR
jgi:hypothetical protein